MHIKYLNYRHDVIVFFFHLIGVLGFWGFGVLVIWSLPSLDFFETMEIVDPMGDLPLGLGDF